ncbi:hypothetical protein EWM64_g3391 [Hericium alpestre]|uniref:NADP-dependent oxidoreductase domain-containing protein n=1 Tax=Hericium alpestre TaxID=135208 RepID=A0A4Z0A2E2_9AGAM|nr:hypothetical protein EWM64_g3391 [Hericium alpestre]
MCRIQHALFGFSRSMNTAHAITSAAARQLSAVRAVQMDFGDRRRRYGRVTPGRLLALLRAVHCHSVLPEAPPAFHMDTNNSTNRKHLPFELTIPPHIVYLVGKPFQIIFKEAMSFFTAAPKPPTPLGLYRPLSSLAGVRVSPFQLGAMSIGNKWKSMGALDKEKSFELLDAYFALGGNFVDTASSYHDGESEEFIGEWLEKRGIRDQIVVATKYTHFYKEADPSIKQRTAYVGNNAKSLHVSVNASLEKLCTSYIDILYVHWWDWETGVEEIMNSLHNLVVSGKILYLGISDTPAWVVTKANQYARDHGKTPFVIYQGQWNVLQRSFEREIIPMARAEGLALAPWDVLAGGKLRTDAEEQRRREAGVDERGGSGWARTEAERTMSLALEKVAKEIRAKSIQAVAIAYVMQKTINVFPVIGGRKIEYLKANIEALELTLTKEHIAYIESVVPFDPGFPYTLIGDGTSQGFLMKITLGEQAVSWPHKQAIVPSKNDA